MILSMWMNIDCLSFCSFDTMLQIIIMYRIKITINLNILLISIDVDYLSEK